MEGRMKTAINMLPQVYRRQNLARRRVVQWTVVLCAALSAIWAARWYKDREQRTLNQQLEAVAREGRPAQAMLGEITRMRHQIQQLQQHETIAQELEQQRQVIALLGAVSSAALQTDGRLRVLDCRVVDLQATDAAQVRGSQTGPAGTVTLAGLALDSPTVAEFHDGLLQSGLFADVKLIKSNEMDEVGIPMHHYEVRCEL
jgi:Tfp pilus assembly protein PilN